MYSRLTYICLFLLFLSRPSCSANVNSPVSDDINTKNIVSFNYVDNKNNQSDYEDVRIEGNEGRNYDTSVGRTFGRPMKKMMAALIPLVFQMGAASTWAVVAALVGVKTLLVALVILKLLLVAGAAKVGTLFGQKAHAHGHGWEAPSHQKEIHLHIHNGQHGTALEEHVPISPWSREGTASSDNKNLNLVLNPYAAAAAGPQTISTPFGNYVRVESPQVLDSLSSLTSHT